MEIKAKMNDKLFSAIGNFILCSAALLTAASYNWNNPSGTLPAGCRHLTFHSAANKTDIGYNIYLPPSYDSAGATRFPVVYSLHGMGGNESGNITLASTLQSNINSKTVKPMIMVFVNGKGDSFFADAKNGSIMCETSIIKELIPHIDSLFLTIPNRASRGVNGVSMGGFGAMMLAFKHPDLFGHVGTFIAALVDWDTLRDQQFDKTIPTNIFGSDSNYFNNNYYPFTFVKKNADTLKTVGMKVRMADGDKDFTMGPLFLYNLAMRDLLASKGIPVVFDTIKGGAHAIDLSSAVAVNMLKFHSENFAAATSVTTPSQRSSAGVSSASVRARVVTTATFAIPKQWHSISKEVAMYSPLGKLLGRESIVDKSMINISALAGRFSTNVLFVKPVIE
jgi:S-formylglutathione hydrolase FrmB